MRDGIHIPAGVVRLTVLALAVGIAAVIGSTLPEARRYLKIETM